MYKIEICAIRSYNVTVKRKPQEQKVIQTSASSGVVSISVNITNSTSSFSCVSHNTRSVDFLVI